MSEQCSDDYLRVVSALLIKNSSHLAPQVLLCLRKNTRHFPGYWSLPIGHIEELETPLDAIRRELYEELGIQLIDAHCLTRLFDPANKVDHSVFVIDDWRGEPENLETELCELVDWFTFEDLPSPLTPISFTILQSFQD